MSTCHSPMSTCPLLIADLPCPPLPTRHARLLRTRGIRCCSLDVSGLVVVNGEIKSKGKTSLLPSEAVTDMGPLLPSQPSLRSGSHAHLCQSVNFRPTPSPPWPAVVREIRQPARRLYLPYAACLQQDLYRVGQLVRWIRQLVRWIRQLVRWIRQLARLISRPYAASLEQHFHRLSVQIRCSLCPLHACIPITISHCHPSFTR
jgi:hypothetical protein